MRVVALQGDYFQDGRSEIFDFLSDYCSQRKLQFRQGAYTGSGWDVDDYARVMQKGGEDFGQQLGSYMVRLWAHSWTGTFKYRFYGRSVLSLRLTVTQAGQVASSYSSWLM